MKWAWDQVKLVVHDVKGCKVKHLDDVFIVKKVKKIRPPKPWLKKEEEVKPPLTWYEKAFYKALQHPAVALVIRKGKEGAAYVYKQYKERFEPWVTPYIEKGKQKYKKLEAKIIEKYKKHIQRRVKKVTDPVYKKYIVYKDKAKILKRQALEKYY